MRWICSLSWLKRFHTIFHSMNKVMTLHTSSRNDEWAYSILCIDHCHHKASAMLAGPAPSVVWWCHNKQARSRPGCSTATTRATIYGRQYSSHFNRKPVIKRGGRSSSVWSRPKCRDWVSNATENETCSPRYQILFIIHIRRLWPADDKISHWDEYSRNAGCVELRPQTESSSSVHD